MVCMWGRVIKCDTEGKKYTIRIYEDYYILKDWLIPYRAQVYGKGKFHQVKITDMYFTIDWTKEGKDTTLVVEIENESEEKLPDDVEFAFTVIPLDEKENFSGWFELPIIRDDNNV